MDRVAEREITTEQLEPLLNWLEAEPVVPEGRWFRTFRDFTVCGEGEWIKSFLRPDPAALGEELD